MSVSTLAVFPFAGVNVMSTSSPLSGSSAAAVTVVKYVTYSSFSVPSSYVRVPAGITT